MLLRKLNYSSCTAMYCNYAQNVIHVEASFGGILSWCFFCSLYCFLLVLFSLAWLLRILHVIPTSILSLKPVLAFRVYFSPGTCTCCSFTEEPFQVFFLILAFSETKKEPAPFRGVNSGFT